MRHSIRRVLVVVAHGDDETLGAGGTIARLADEGVSVSLCVLTYDDGSRCGADRAPVDRRPAIAKAAEILGIEHVMVHEFDDCRLDELGQLQINKVVEAAVREVGPDTVLTTSFADLNHDHRIAGTAARVAARPGRSSVSEVLCFEVRSSTDTGEASGIEPRFHPNTWRVLRPEHLERKIDALRAYGQEVEDWPAPRSERAVTALAEYRGAQVSVPYAEAFQLVRSTW